MLAGLSALVRQRRLTVLKWYCTQVGDPQPKEEDILDMEGEGGEELEGKNRKKKGKGKEGKKKTVAKKLGKPKVEKLLDKKDVKEVVEDEGEWDGKSIRHTYPVLEEDREWVEEKLKENPNFVYRPVIIEDSDSDTDDESENDIEDEELVEYLKEAKEIKSGFRFKNENGELRLVCPVINCGNDYAHTQNVNRHITSKHPKFKKDFINMGKVTYSASHIGIVNRYLKIVKEYLLEGKMPPPEITIDSNNNNNNNSE